jgi:hypothetical protein
VVHAEAPRGGLDLPAVAEHEATDLGLDLGQDGHRRTPRGREGDEALGAAVLAEHAEEAVARAARGRDADPLEAHGELGRVTEEDLPFLRVSADVLGVRIDESVQGPPVAERERLEQRDEGARVRG